jgi:hypothetical protein
MKTPILALGALAVLASTACAQETMRRSQLGVVTQWIGGTKVELTYRRPVARGRALFGALVPYHKTWTPSADSAARLTITAPIEINGQRLDAGSYSLWAVPDSVDWQMRFNSTANAFHLSVPSSGYVLTVHAKPEKGEHVETLMFDFPMIDADSARLELRWGTTVVPFRLKALSP